VNNETFAEFAKNDLDLDDDIFDTVLGMYLKKIKIYLFTFFTLCLTYVLYAIYSDDISTF
jgi:hypothetical protein